MAWPGSGLLQGDAAEAVAELKRRPGLELQVHGSGDLVSTLGRHDLVDEHRPLTFPVLLGTGKRRFRQGCVGHLPTGRIDGRHHRCHGANARAGRKARIRPSGGLSAQLTASTAVTSSSSWAQLLVKCLFGSSIWL